ncbi:O-methyltransferase [Aureispira anguillae]|uniref:O-methyltransferase n=1 Tax=Aureispira anguillae TaxID=2864201 RepID=A0A915YIC3_9BACT|nr:O-methyltransferase [Aureispira anguillae]BDS13549.1 O-methyltransferase [Aureispira anguillae]
MKLTPNKIEEYAKQHTKVYDSSVLDRLERKTHLEVMRPQMLSGYLQGQFLAFFSKMKQPKAILEIGTYTGYSAICLAQGLQQNGVLHTIDINKELEAIATEYIHQAGVDDRIIQHQGNALEIIPTIDKQWDLIFLDADKINYSQYYDMVLPKLKIGGVIIADNVLWHGKVVEGSREKRASALAVFNKKVTEDDRVDNVLLPLRDGLMLIEKKSD